MPAALTDIVLGTIWSDFRDNVECERPATVNAGDLVCIWPTQNDNETPAGVFTDPPGGWVSRLAAEVGDHGTCELYSKIAGAGEGNIQVETDTFVFGNDIGRGPYFRFTDHDGFDDAVGAFAISTGNAVGGSYSAPSITPSVDGCLIVTALYIRNSGEAPGTLVIPGILTTKDADGGVSDEMHHGVATGIQATAGATGAMSWSGIAPATAQVMAISFAVKPVPAADSTPPSEDTAPAVDTRTTTTVRVDGTFTDAVEANVNHYAVALARSAAAPATGADIANLTGNAASPLASGNDLAVANGVEGSILLSGLTSGALLDIYYTASDGTNFTAPVLLQTSALNPPVFSGTIPTQNWTRLTAIAPIDLDDFFAPDATTYAQISGSLPAGVSLSGSVISGTPTVIGSDDVQFSGTNADGSSNTNTFTVSVAVEAPVFSGTIPAQNWVQGVAITPIDLDDFFDPDAAYSQIAGTLPAGVTLAAGVISGTPTEIGSFNGQQFRGTNGTGQDDTNAFNVAVAVAAPVFSGTIPTQNWVRLTPITPIDLDDFFAPDADTYSQIAGTLPAGVTLTGSLIDGTPTETFTDDVSFRGTNGTGQDDTNTFTVNVAVEAPVFAGPIGAQSWQQNVAITPIDLDDFFTPDASSYSLIAGTLPAGVTLTGSVISGTPTESGDFNGLQFRGTNATGTDDTNAFNSTVDPIAPVFSGTIPAQNWQQGVAITPIDLSTFFTPTPTSYTQVAGALPSGVTLAAGVISGTPTVSGDFNGLQFRGVNTTGFGETNSFNVSVAVAPPVFSGTIAAQSWQQNVAIAPINLASFFEPDPATYSQIAGTLPVGVTLSGGIISGTPTQFGSFNGLQFRGTNASGQDDTNTFNATVAVAAPVFSGSIPTQNWVDGVPINPLDLDDYFAPDADTYSQIAGTLPAGVSLSGSVISGTPTETGAFNGQQFRGTNTSGTDDTNTFNVNVAVALSLSATAQSANVAPGSTFGVTLSGFAQAPTSATLNGVSVTISNALVGSVTVAVPDIAEFSSAGLMANSRFYQPLDLIITEPGGSAVTQVSVVPQDFDGPNQWFGLAGDFDGVWISRSELQLLPRSGAAFTRLQAAAQGAWGSADLSALENQHDVLTLSGAIYAAMTGDATIEAKVIAALQETLLSGTNTVLELARGLQAYVIAADLINYQDAGFRAQVATWVDANIPGHSTANSLRETALRSANNWGGHARASLAAAGVYLGNATMLDDAEQGHLEFIGEYNGDNPQMLYEDAPETAWHFDTNDKAGVNRADAGFLSGVIPEDWRRDLAIDNTAINGFTQLSDLNAVVATYLWEAMQGFVTAAIILHRARRVSVHRGTALQRAIEVLYNTAHDPIGDDRWIPYVINQYLGTSLTLPTIQDGKGMGWTDVTSQVDVLSFPANSIFPAGLTKGDPYYFEELTGDFQYITPDGVAPLAAAPPATARLRYFDEDAGSWSAVDNINVQLLDVDGPIPLSASIDTAGEFLTVVYNESVEFGADGAAGFNLENSATFLLAPTGIGTDTLVFEIGEVIRQGDAPTFGFTQPGDGLRDLSISNNPAETITGFPILNQSLILNAQPNSIAGRERLPASGAFVVNVVSAPGAIRGQPSLIASVAELQVQGSFTGVIQSKLASLVGRIAPNTQIGSSAIRSIKAALIATVAPWRSKVTLREDDICLLEDFLPYLLPYLPGAPRALVLQHLLEVLEDFCEHSRQWLFTSAPIDIRAAQEVYEIPITENTEVVQFEKVLLDGLPVEPIDEGDMLRNVQSRGYHRYRGRILITPMPRKDNDAGMQIYMSLKPKAGVEGIPKALFDNWRQTICEGTLSRLLLMPGRSWTDQKLAVLNSDKYLVGRNKAEADRRSFHDGKPYRASGANVLRSRRRKSSKYF